MAPTPPPADPKVPAAQPEAQPPDERFWKRYSPHHEAPLSFTGSITAHVLILAVLAGAIPFIPTSCTDPRVDGPDAPPRMDVVEIMGGDPGIDGLGAGNTPAGGDKGAKAENVEDSGADKAARPRGKETRVAALQEPAKGPELKFPQNDNEPPDPDGLETAFAGLDKATKQAAADIINATRPKPAPLAKGTTGKRGQNTGNPKAGTGGRPNRGTGRGKGVGAGKGTSPYGQVVTDQRKRQMRWQILASTDGNIHLAKLKALKVTLVMPTLVPGKFTIFDLEHSLLPQTTKRLENQADKVWWTNRDPVEVQALARVLKLRTIPACFVIFLPKALEDRMVQLEEEFQGAREEQIAKTVWDVPLRNGRYASEPQVVQQFLKGPR